MSKHVKTVICLVLYLAAIVAATFTIKAFGPQASIYNAFAFIGLTIALRDQLHDFWQTHRTQKMAALIAAGGILTLIVNPSAGGLAAASAIAFVLSEVVDYITYQLLHRRPWMERSNGSNLPSALVDSIVFPTLAFGGLNVALTVGQFTAKVAGGLLFSLIIVSFKRRRNEPVPEAVAA